MNLVGSVEGCDVIIIDDMIDTAGTLCEAANQLKGRGANKVYCFATHGLFSKDAYEKIEKSYLHEIIVTNSIPLPDAETGSTIKELRPKPIGATNKIK
jgi:ribose-phosphate pyrophosphokinase